MIFFLYGPDTFRSREKLRLIKEKFLKEVDVSGRSLIELNKNEIDLNHLRQALNTNSFLTRKRMVIIEGILSKKITNEEEIIELLKRNNLDNSCVLVFWEADDYEQDSKIFKYLKSQKQVEEFKKLKNVELMKWVKNKFLSNKIRIENKQVEKIINFVGDDMWLLDREIDKLTAHNWLEKEVNDLSLELILTASFNENIFQLTDAVTEKKQALALQLIDKHLSSGINESYLLAMLIRQFRIMLQIKNLSEFGHNLNQINSLLNYHPYVIKKTWSQSTKYNLENLKSIYNQLLAIDGALKTGSKNFKTLIDLLVFNNY